MYQPCGFVGAECHGEYLDERNGVTSREDLSDCTVHLVLLQ